MAVDNTKNTRYYNPNVTTGGTYENPRLGITDFTQYKKGFDAGMKPGLDYIGEVEEEFIKRTEKADEIKDIDVASGDFFDGNTFNPDVNMINDYKGVVDNYRNVLLNRNSTQQEIKDAENSVAHLRNSNQNLAYLLEVDADRELYSPRASAGINELFTDAGIENGLDGFKNAYNEGRVKPTVKNINGNNVGGFEVMLPNGKKVFVDFENKINSTTIDGKMNLRTDKIIQENAQNFEKNTDFGFEKGVREIHNTSKYKTIKNNDNLTQTEKLTETKKLYDDYINNVKSQANSQAGVLLMNNPEYLADVFVQMQDATYLTPDQRIALNTMFSGSFGSKNEYNMNAINDGVGTIKGATQRLQEQRDAGNMSYTLLDAQNAVKKEFDNARLAMARGFLGNEYMKEVTGAVIGDDGRVTFQEPTSEVAISTTPITPSGSTGGGGDGTGVGGDSSTVSPRDVAMHTELVDAMKPYIQTGGPPITDPSNLKFSDFLNLESGGGAHRPIYDINQQTAAIKDIVPTLNKFVTGYKDMGGVEFMDVKSAKAKFDSMKVEKEDGTTTIMDNTGNEVPASVYKKYERMFNNPKNVLFEFSQNGEFVAHKFGDDKDNRPGEGGVSISALGEILRGKISTETERKKFDNVFYGQSYIEYRKQVGEMKTFEETFSYVKTEKDKGITGFGYNGELLFNKMDQNQKVKFLYALKQQESLKNNETGEVDLNVFYKSMSTEDVIDLKEAIKKYEELLKKNT